METEKFDYEKDLWDKIVLSLVNKDCNYTTPAAVANFIIKARRKFFEQENS